MVDSIQVVLHPNWHGANEELYAAISVWPAWTEVKKIGPAGQFIPSNFITHFGNHDYALRSDGLSYSLCRLVRQPFDQRSPWDWSSCNHIEESSFDQGNQSRESAEAVRLRLPELVARRWIEWVESETHVHSNDEADVEHFFPLGHSLENETRGQCVSVWPRWARYAKHLSTGEDDVLYRTCFSEKNYLLYQMREYDLSGDVPVPRLIPSLLLIYLQPLAPAEEFAWRYHHFAEIHITGLEVGQPARSSLARARLELPSILLP